MIVLKYIGSILRDYTTDGTPFKILSREGLKNADDTFFCRFQGTNIDENWNAPELDLSQSLAVMIPNENTYLRKADFDIYFVDNDNYITKLTLFDKDFVNNSFKCNVEKLPQKVVYNTPLKYWKDYDENKWIYYISDVNRNAIYRLNLNTKIAEFVKTVDKSYIQDFDEKTGYGIFDFTKLTDNNIELSSFIKDTEIDVPNNFYVTALAIKMAMAYKIKQGADTSQLTLQYSELINEFYNSQSNDAASFGRMGNVY